MEPFVKYNSIVRKIWGKGDTILLIFAGAAAEFALNKAVDWLYFTGRLPADPLKRLFSTVSYARKIIFEENERALKTIDSIYDIHKGVEKNRGSTIPDWAYRDVLNMLIYYSISSFEALERKLTLKEKEEIFEVFYRFGTRMKIKNLATNYNDWQLQRTEDMKNNLDKSKFTIDLYQQYKKHLGSFRYHILIETQKQIVPKTVRTKLNLKSGSQLWFFLPVYKFSRRIHLHQLIRNLIIPQAYLKEVKELDIQ